MSASEGKAAYATARTMVELPNGQIMGKTPMAAGSYAHRPNPTGESLKSGSVGSMPEARRHAFLGE
jgi:hypothetical protein